jgi:hypothetical protein
VGASSSMALGTCSLSLSLSVFQMASFFLFIKLSVFHCPFFCFILGCLLFSACFYLHLEWLKKGLAIFKNQ